MRFRSGPPMLRIAIRRLPNTTFILGMTFGTLPIALRPTQNTFRSLPNATFHTWETSGRVRLRFASCHKASEPSKRHFERERNVRKRPDPLRTVQTKVRKRPDPLRIMQTKVRKAPERWYAPTSNCEASSEQPGKRPSTIWSVRTTYLYDLNTIRSLRRGCQADLASRAFEKFRDRIHPWERRRLDAPP